MKYYNREYGFKGRPPFFKDYFEVNDKGPRVNIANFPWDSIVGFGLHYNERNGVALIGKKGSVWGAKLTYLQGSRWTEQENIAAEKGSFFACSADNKFAYFTLGDIATSIVNYKKSALVMSISAIKKTSVRVKFYPIVPDDGALTVQNNIVRGVSSARAVIKGEIIPKDYDVEFRDRYEVILDDKNAKKEFFFAKSYTRTSIASSNKKEVTFEFELSSADPHAVIYLEVDSKNEFNGIPTLDELNQGISRAEILYSAEKTTGSGTLCKNVSNIISNTCINRIYDPYLMDCVFVEKREKNQFYYNFDPTYMATGALIASLIGQFKSAMSQIEVSCGDKIMGAFSSWVLFMRSRDKEVILKTLPIIMQSFGDSSDLELVDPLTKREIAYKQVGSPLKETRNEAHYSLDFSCYKLLAFDIIERMCRIIGDTKRSSHYREKYNQLKININKTLFNEKLGMYMDRYLEGEFVEFYGASNFLPLVAGTIDDVDRLEIVIQNLKDQTKFWGEYVIPSISKNNCYYGKKLTNIDGTQNEPYNKYRGGIIPVFNYLIHQGLIRYGITDLRGELAVSSCKLWDIEYSANKSIPCFFKPTNNPEKKSSDNCLSGNLMGYIGFEEVIGVEYFRDDLRPALRFGSLAKGDSGIANYKFWGLNFTVNISEKRTSLTVSGKEVINGEGGKYVVRNLVVNKEGIEFIVLADNDIVFDIKMPIFPNLDMEERSYNFNVEKGKTKIVIEKHKIRPIRNKFNN